MDRTVQPSVSYQAAQASIKNEDVLLVQPDNKFPKPRSFRNGTYAGLETISDSASSVYGLDRPSYSSASELDERLPSDPSATYGLFCVLDGHNGDAAALHVKESLPQAIEERMPAGNPPPESDHKRYTAWREAIQQALVGALLEVNEAFACKGMLAGCTATIAIQTGWLVTFANVGDSRATLDCGGELMQVTVDHRIATHKGDRARLESLGARIAPIDASGHGPAMGSHGYGPLRVWPGGLCLSRGVGDFDVGAPVICCPQIYQVRIPRTGGRIMIASDGVWDAFENMKRLGRMARAWSTQSAPDRIIQAIQRAYGGLKDDTTLIVLDLLPPGTQFQQVGRATDANGVVAGNGCLCFAPTPKREQAEARPLERPEVLADIDVAAAVGLMPDAVVSPAPSWCTDQYAQMVREAQAAACRAWNEAKSMKRMGRMPSRENLASFFTAVHSLRPLPEHSVHGASGSPDISVRVGSRSRSGTLSTSPEETESADITVKLGKRALAPVPAGGSPTSADGEVEERVRFGAGPSERSAALSEDDNNASVRFANAIAKSPEEFAGKFGPYRGRVSEDFKPADGAGLTSPSTSHRVPSKESLAEEEELQAVQEIEAPQTSADQSEHPFANVWEGAALSPWNSVRSQHGDDVMAAVPEEQVHDSLASMPSSSGDPKPYEALEGSASLPATTPAGSLRALSDGASPGSPADGVDETMRRGKPLGKPGGLASGRLGATRRQPKSVHFPEQ